MLRTVVSLPGCMCVEGFASSPRDSNEKHWLVISVDHSRKNSPLHFMLESASQVDARRKSVAIAVLRVEAVLGIVRFLGGIETCVHTPAGSYRLSSCFSRVVLLFRTFVDGP